MATSTDTVDLQAQVESVLGALIKAASAELMKLFESRYGASAADVGHAGDSRKSETLQTQHSLWSGDTKRSIGVQVEDDICPLLDLSGACVCFVFCMLKGIGVRRCRQH